MNIPVTKRTRKNLSRLNVCWLHAGLCLGYTDKKVIRYEKTYLSTMKTITKTTLVNRPPYEHVNAVSVIGIIESTYDLL